MEVGLFVNVCIGCVWLCGEVCFCLLFEIWFDSVIFVGEWLVG